jgi:hypothetical protein
MKLRRMRSLIGLLLLLIAMSAKAEPYLAVQTGFKCSQCHDNPTGGGMRTAFGNLFAQTQMPAKQIDTGSDLWTGQVTSFLAVGGDLRADATATQVKHQPTISQFEIEQARVYFDASIIPGRLSVYVDELVAPGSASNREAYGRYWSKDHDWYVKAGQFYLPFGLRLQDDTAFIRTAAGINMTTPDNGVEFGWERGAWSAQAAVTNGDAGGAETDNSKQVSTQAVYVNQRWRLGLAANINNTDAGDRRAYGLFGGLRTGPIAWLAEADLISDDGFPDGERRTVSALLEGNWNFLRGHNLKITAEYLDPDRNVSEDQQTRWSFVYEFTPIQFLQLRLGSRFYDGIPQNELQNRRFYFVQLHGFF